MGCLTQYVYAANSKGNCVSECNVVYDMVMKDLVIPPQSASGWTLFREKSVAQIHMRR